MPTSHCQPPTEASSTRSRHKTCQVRRPVNLIRHKHKQEEYPAHSNKYHQLQHQIKQEWSCIKTAQGYGSQWQHWILAFDTITYIPQEPPPIAELYELQITRLDANQFAFQETTRQIESQKTLYTPGPSIKVIRPHILCTFDIKTSTQCPEQSRAYPAKRAKLRATKNQRNVQYDGTGFLPKPICLDIIAVKLPSNGVITQTQHLYEIHEIDQTREAFWGPFWNRDSQEEQDPTLWQAIDSIIQALPPQTPLQIQINNPHILWTTIHKLKPFKAHGADGWRAEEQQLPYNAITELATRTVFKFDAGQNHVSCQKRISCHRFDCTRPTSPDLGYISRLTSGRGPGSAAMAHDGPRVFGTP